MADSPSSPGRPALTSAPPSSRMDSMVIIAQAMAKRGELEAALGVLQDARREADERGMHVEFLDYTMGDILANMQRWAEAESAFNSEIEHYPDHLQAYASLAVVAVLSGQFDKVDVTLNRMVQANPGRNACLTAAETLEALGDNRTAARWRQRAEELN